MSPTVIAIDGPAASGKTTVGRLLADRLDYLCLDTGSMYRAVTFGVLDKGIDADDEAAVGRYAAEAQIEISTDQKADGRAYTVLLDGEDVTWQLRSRAVDRNVSRVSAYRRVRTVLVERQRMIAAEGHVILVGRDIGTVVLPDAPLKLYITASAEERARRRWQERHEQGASTSYDEVLTDVIRRDRLDSSRELSPLEAAHDAVILDSTSTSPQTLVEQILQLFVQADLCGSAVKD